MGNRSSLPTLEELRASLLTDLRTRIRPVVPDTPDAEFERLIAQMVRVKLKYFERERPKRWQ